MADDTTVNKSKKKKPSPQAVGKIQILFSVISDGKVTEVDKEGTTKNVEVSIETFYIGGHTKKPIQVFQRKMKRLKYGNYKKNIILGLNIYELLHLEFNSQTNTPMFSQLLNDGSERDPCYGYLQNTGNRQWVAAFQYTDINAQITNTLEESTGALNDDWKLLFMNSLNKEQKYNYTECKTAKNMGASFFLKTPYILESAMVQEYISLHTLPTQPNPETLYTGKCLSKPLIQQYESNFTPGLNTNEITQFGSSYTQTIHKNYTSNASKQLSDVFIYFDQWGYSIKDTLVLSETSNATYSGYSWNYFDLSQYNPVPVDGQSTKDSSGESTTYIKGTMTCLSDGNELMENYMKQTFHTEAYSGYSNMGRAPYAQFQESLKDRTDIQIPTIIYYGGRGGVGDKQQGGIRQINGVTSRATTNRDLSRPSAWDPYTGVDQTISSNDSWTQVEIKSNFLSSNSLYFRREYRDDRIVLDELEGIGLLLNEINNKFTQVDVTFYNVLYNKVQALGSEEIWTKDCLMDVEKYEYDQKSKKYVKTKQKHKVFSLGYSKKDKPTICMIHAYSFHPK